MQLLDLPTELLGLCCDQIVRSPDVRDEWGEVQETSEQISQTNLRALRLTCKQLSHVATARLFSHVYLHPTRESAQKAQQVLEDQHMNQFVHAISVRASLNTCVREPDCPRPSWDCEDEDDPEWECDGDDEEHAIDTTGELSATFKRLLERIGLFPNLNCLEIIYDHHATSPSQEHLMLYLGRHTLEYAFYRDTFLRKVLYALNHPDHPARKLHTLSIVNLQDAVNVEIATSQDFKTVLSRLKNLELCIVSECHADGSESDIHISERYDFYSGDLQKYWLQPLQEFGQLTRLKLYGNIPWGYFPKCDLRGLHFPKLTSLSLGYMTFTHDWQLDWILSHGATLRSLTLENCPIIPDAKLSHKLDKEGYPIVEQLHGFSRTESDYKRWTYASRWHTYFNKIRAGLPKLKRFVVGKGPWDYCDESDRASAAFAAADDLTLKLPAELYCQFQGYVLF